MKFNLNSTIKVRIHKKGYELLSKGNNTFFYNHPDENGYTEMMAWKFIDAFGKLGMRLSQHIDINIIINENS